MTKFRVILKHLIFFNILAKLKQDERINDHNKFPKREGRS